MTNQMNGGRGGLFRSRRHRRQDVLPQREAQPEVADRGTACVWQAAGICPGQRQVDARGRLICICAQVLMAPSPHRVIDTFTDLGLTDEQIGRYFHIPTQCVTALRQPA